MPISVLTKQKEVDVTTRMQRSNISMIKEMMFLAEQEKRKGKDIVSLGVGIPYYKMPETIKQAAIKELQNNPNIDKYTFFAGLPKLRQLLASISTNQLKIPTEEDNILVTPGSMASLLYCMLTLIEEDDEVIVPSPYFASYAQQILIAGGRIVEVPMIESKDKQGFHLNLKKIEASITNKTKAILINSPQNPTGTVYTESELRELAKIIKGKNIYVITDEVYDYLIYDNAKYFNIASIKSLWPNVIRCCSFSKRFGMTGWRIGYLHTNKELLNYFLKIHDNTIVCAPHIAQMAVFHGLSTPSTEINKNVESLKKNRDLICQRLSKLPDLFSYKVPQGTYYIFPKYNLPLLSPQLALKLLYEAQVVTIPGIGFGQGGEHHLRLSFGSSKEDINSAFDRLDKWWRNYKRK